MHCKKIFVFYPLLLICGLLSFCFLSSALDPQGPLALSMGGSGRAVTQAGAEYHLINPAGLIHASGFHAGAYYMFEVKERKPAWGFSLSETRQVPLALSYIKERQSEEQYFSISTAGFVVPGWSLGLSLSRWQTAQEEANWNIQTGILIKPPQSSFAVGATWDHILPLEGAFEEKRRWGFGLAYKLYEGFFLRADAFYNQNTKWLTAGGVKAVFSKFLVLRLASHWHFTKEIFLFSGGIGLETPQISLDYGLSQMGEEKDWLHTINVRFVF